MRAWVLASMAWAWRARRQHQARSTRTSAYISPYPRRGVYGVRPGGAMTVAMEEPFILFDDARESGAPARLYRAPFETIRAMSCEVRPALERLRAAVAAGRTRRAI